MNIAILFYGKLNTCIKNYNNTIQIFDKNNNYDFFLSSDNSYEKLLNEFIKLYKPKAYTNEKIIYNENEIVINKHPQYLTNKDADNLKRHYINKKRVFELLEQYIKNTKNKYDIIMSLRLDLIFFEKLEFQKIEENTIYIPKIFRNSDRKYFLGEITDQIAYGNFNVMKKYMYIYDNCINLQKNYTYLAHPETLTFANLFVNNINIFLIDLDYELDIYKHHIFILEE